MNLSAFWTEIEDYQATVTNGQLDVLRGYLANAGKVRTRGIEIDSAFRPMSRLSLYANGAFTDARYVCFVDAPCPPKHAGGPVGSARLIVAFPANLCPVFPNGHFLTAQNIIRRFASPPLTANFISAMMQLPAALFIRPLPVNIHQSSGTFDQQLSHWGEGAG